MPDEYGTTMDPVFYFVQFASRISVLSNNNKIEHSLRHVRIEVLTAASMKMTAFWDIAPYSLAGVARRFRVTYCLHQYALLERLSTSTRLHGVMPKKAVIFIP
jgi:hypothetical protein